MLETLFIGLVIVLLFLLLLWFLKAPSSPVQIRDRHILITGGSSGIGLEVAKLAVAEGARKVTLVARNVDRLKEAKKIVEDSLAPGSSTEVSFQRADVVDKASIEKAIEEAGPVDVLVCSHGLAIPCTFEEASVDDIHKMGDINYFGTLHAVMAALPGMKENKGAYARSIAIFSSQAAQAGMFGYSTYSGTKSGVVLFAQGFKQECFLDNIQISVIYPPDTDTPGFHEENKSKPEITKILSASSGAMTAVEVARISLDGIKAGQFTVACNFDGFLLSICNAGMSPQTSVVHAALEILLAPVVRLIALFVLHGWYRTIRRVRPKLKSS